MMATKSNENIPFGVGLLTVKDGKILCGVRKDNGQVCGPGGYIKDGETPEEAAKREAFEKFGIKPRKVICIGASKWADQFSPCMQFVCSDFDGKPAAVGDKIITASYVDMNDLLNGKMDVYPPFRDGCDKLLDAIEAGKVNSSIDFSAKNGTINREGVESVADGGKGSGNWGHAGRPGIRGGSSSKGGALSSGSIPAVGEVVSGKNGDLRPKSEGAKTIDTSDAFAESKKQKNSLTEHMDENGNLSPERQKVHDEIIKKFFEEKMPYDGQATLIMAGGGPASGKSFVSDTANGKFGEETTVKIDPDDAKHLLPGYDEMAKSADKEMSKAAAGYYHEESSALAKRMYQYAVDNNINVVYDGTGNGSVKSVEKKLNTARDGGYKIEAEYVTVDINEALKRNQKRYDDAKAAYESGKSDMPPRLPDPEVVTKTHKAVSDISIQVANKYDSFVLYDNNGPKGSKPVVIATCAKGGQLMAAPGMESKLQAYLDKGDSGAKVVDGKVVY